MSTSAHPDRLNGAVKLAFFAAFVLILVGLLDTLINHGLRRIDTSSFGVSNMIVDGEINADILITGSSRALSHYDPRIIQDRTGLNAFNIGLNGSQTDMQVARLKTYLRHNKPPRLLVHNLDAFSFQISHGGVYNPAQYVPYLKESAIYDALERVEPDVWKARFIPLYGYTAQDMSFAWVQGVLGVLGWNPKQDHFLGFKPRDVDWTEDFERLRSAHPQGMKIEIEPAGVQQMEELLAICAAYKIKPILVYSPEYVEMQRLTSNRSEIFARVAELSRKFDVEMWDYSSSSISQSRQNFYNSQHLNARGAEAFSQQLAARIASDPGITMALSEAHAP